MQIKTPNPPGEQNADLKYFSAWYGIILRINKKKEKEPKAVSIHLIKGVIH